ncbi:PEP/pyruvate-binding domain-containing protein [Maridesulfovibrio sp.]|uniref:PEP/pyruvate-binding domain-containing protein n=1 Tax=Maridesulfovibrio sp. TaxID=2795000 RepID=UPI002A18AFEF|nr:PEP/pyruvate-binding domain-containing protein [Maridesulfovibrio sp.]
MSRLFNFMHRIFGKRRVGKPRSFADLFNSFNSVLELNNRILTGIASLHSKLGGDYIFDIQYLRSAAQEMEDLVGRLIGALDSMAPGKYMDLYGSLRDICANMRREIAGHPVIPDRLLVPFEETTPREFDLVGAKSYNLARIANVKDLRTPEGISVTTRACLDFMEFNKLDETIAEINAEWTGGQRSLSSASQAISGLILAGNLPPELRRALNSVGDQLFQKTERGIGLAVRSSAWGEDGTHSFAGIFESLINVSQDGIRDAYRRVLASAYSPKAMQYREKLGYKAAETMMAVSFQTMVKAKSSGVVYSLSPTAPLDNTVIISAAWGLGSSVVSGESVVDQFSVSRDEPHEQTSISIVRKEKALRINPAGEGMIEESVPEQMQTMSCLTSEEIRQLVHAALRLEKYFKKPQDIEFAFDDDGSLLILQSRPLHIQSHSEKPAALLNEQLRNHDRLMSGTGDVAQQGIASGPVFLAHNECCLDEFPEGAILVARHSSPVFASVLPRAAGVITDIGSPLGHMATIAREYRVPALLNTGDATERLSEGQVITLDAEQKTVYSGVVRELQLHEAIKERIEEAYEYRLLRRLLRQVEPLNLFDPSDSNFTPKGCLTLHDITRFVHEKAVEELIDINVGKMLDSSSPNGRLKLPVPLDLTIIDIGGGLDNTVPESGRLIEPEQLASAPMSAFVEGVTMAGVWQSSPVPVDFSSFMSSMTRTMPEQLSASPSIGRNLAVISENYTHISLHLGYHFTTINCFMSQNPADNYAYFRFAGGVTGARRRSRRARFLAEVLNRQDFSITVREDLVIARVKKIPAEEILHRMRIIGVLVAYTRQLDVSMVDDSQITRHAEFFENLITDRF